MNRHSLFLMAALLAAVNVMLVGRAVACPAGQYSSMGMCLPEIGGAVGQGAEHLKKELQGQIGGVPLEQWIIASHNTAISGGMPIPANIRQALTGYASEDSMNKVTYKIGDNGFFNLAGALERGGYAAAVTLIDLIVFRGPGDAGDPSIWAHELTHIDQYSQWGVHSFAIQYARDYNSVEAPAYQKGNGYSTWALQHFSMAPTPPPGSAQFGAFCYTQFGRFGPGPVQPVGAPCNVNGALGQVGP